MCVSVCVIRPEYSKLLYYYSSSSVMTYYAELDVNSGTFVRDTEVELCYVFYYKLRNRSVIAIYKLFFGRARVPTVFTTLAKITSSHLIYKICSLRSRQHSFQLYFLILFKYAKILFCVMNSIC